MSKKSWSPWSRNEQADWECLCSDEYRVAVRAGTVLFTQMDVHEYVYLVQYGCVLISIVSTIGQLRTVMFCERGSLFGESCVYEDAKQIYTATAQTDCVLYKLTAAQFKLCMESSASFACAVSQDFFKKSALNFSRMVELTFSDISHRLTTTLIHMAEMYGRKSQDGILLDIHFTQQELADLIGASRVSVNKIMRSLADRGILQKRNAYYTILDYGELLKSSEFI